MKGTLRPVPAVPARVYRIYTKVIYDVELTQTVYTSIDKIQSQLQGNG